CDTRIYMQIDLCHAIAGTCAASQPRRFFRGYTSCDALAIHKSQLQVAMCSGACWLTTRSGRASAQIDSMLDHLSVAVHSLAVSGTKRGQLFARWSLFGLDTNHAFFATTQ